MFLVSLLRRVPFLSNLALILFVFLFNCCRTANDNIASCWCYNRKLLAISVIFCLTIRRLERSGHCPSARCLVVCTAQLIQISLRSHTWPHRFFFITFISLEHLGWAVRTPHPANLKFQFGLFTERWLSTSRHYWRQVSLLVHKSMWVLIW